MITSENLEEVLGSLDSEEVSDALHSRHDYVAIRVYVMNGIYYSSVESVSYSDNLADQLSSDGDMLLDKESFVRILLESRILE